MLWQGVTHKNKLHVSKNRIFKKKDKGSDSTVAHTIIYDDNFTNLACYDSTWINDSCFSNHVTLLGAISSHHILMEALELAKWKCLR